MRTIVYDFNGTILDDVDLCLRLLNIMVEEYKVRTPLTLEEYREVFTFPVENYYKAVGFDFSKKPFSEIGAEWFKLYDQSWRECFLMKDAVSFVKQSKRKGYRTVLLSASKRENLLVQVKELGIEYLFDEIYGIGDIYAKSKVELAERMMVGKNPKQTLFIGDTLHDYDVAKAVGASCILVADGHQSRRVLETSGTKVVDHLKEIKL